MTTVQQLLYLKGHEIVSISPDASMLDAIKLMAENNVGSLVVLENDRLAGIVTERHYARKVFLAGRSSPETTVGEIMTTRVVCARPEQTVEESMAVMTAKAVRHLPVLDKKKLVGIVSIGDLVKSIISDQKLIIEQLEHYISG